MEIDQDTKYAVVAESKDYEKELYLHDLSFAQLMDEIIVPYESSQSFFIDGVPVKKGAFTFGRGVGVPTARDSF